MKRDLESRFWSKVEKKSDDECWIWRSAFIDGRYGTFWVGGEKRNEYAHRVAYRISKGEIPKGMLIMHSCDNPACVNPNHLSVGTHNENMLDAMNKNRSGCLKQHGSRNPIVKLSEISVQRIRIVGSALPQSKVAKLVGISRENVGQVLRNSTWKHVSSNKQALA